MLTNEEIESHIKRLDVQLECAQNGILDRAASPNFNRDDPAVAESHETLKHLRGQRELLVKELQRRRGAQ